MGRAARLLAVPLLALAALLPPAVAVAQDDRDWLTAYLEDNLSDAGREVRITGFAGALSSRATFDTLTIADGEGVWLTLRDGALSWNRAGLLGRRIEISELSAAEIDLPRAPVSAETQGLPAAEAAGFSLPELPVSVSIGALRVDRLRLGATLLGQAAEMRVAGFVRLEGGEGEAELALERTDGKRGEITLTGAYSNQSREARIDLLLREDADGIAAGLLGLPEQPALTLAVHGSGPVTRFRADLALSTDGEPRLKGAVTLGADKAQAGQPVRRTFSAELAGDLAPLFRPEYRAFFGGEITLDAEGAREPSGEMVLERIEIATAEARVSGSAALTASGMPRMFALDIDLADPAGGAVLLPLPGAPVTLRSASLRLGFDAAHDDGWSLKGDLRGLRQDGIAIAALRLQGSGRIAPARGLVGGTLSFVAGGLAPTDAAIATALGPTVTGRAIFTRQTDGPLRVPKLRVTGQGYGAEGGLALEWRDEDLALSGRIQARLSDIGRLSGLVGRPLGGAARLDFSGEAGLLSGLLDLEARLAGSDLRLGQDELDAALRGPSRLEISLRRDLNGTDLRRLEIVAGTLTARASGRLESDAANLKAGLDFTDLTVLGRGWRGALSADVIYAATGGLQKLEALAEGRDLGMGVPLADALLAGSSALSLKAGAVGGDIDIEAFRLDNPQLSASAAGKVSGGVRRLEVSARLADVRLLAPGFSGPVTAQGGIAEDAAGYAVDLAAEGPAGSTARIAGRVARDFASADLALAGGFEAALANAFIAPRSVQGPVRFDLRLAGAPALSSLSGNLALSGARIVAPVLGYAMEAVELTAALAGGSARIEAAGNVVGGGRLRISGPVGLTAPYSGDLAVRVEAARLRDPALYESTVSGALSLTGPLSGGARIAGELALGETELRLAATGLGAGGVIPDLTHRAEPAPVRATRGRAGLLDGEGGRGSVARPYPLDITLSAPRRIFVRGRGLDAELGGSLRLGGTSAAIVPAGEFRLIRGRLDILGKRFSLDEGLVQLQGSFIPFIRFLASTSAEGVTAMIGIEGPATAPVITITSQPDLPEEEVLALLLFGRGLASLSPFQAAQLASAVATLAGKGGAGIVDRIRQGMGLDDLDFTTDETGGTALRAGKYLSEKLYTDITLGADGKSAIRLNLDLTPSVTLRGEVGSAGGSGLGVFFERDY